MRALEGAVHSSLAKSLNGAKPADAWKLCDAAKGVLPVDRESVLVRTVADQLAGPLNKAKKWEAALAIYDQGLKRLIR